MDTVEARFPPLGRDVRALMVWPAFPNSFWSFNESLKIFGKKAMLPPLGLATVAALCPAHWTIRIVDQAVSPLDDEDLAWANLVMVSAMRVQRIGVREVLGRASRMGKRTMIGGPYASAEPDELLKFADHVVVGEPDECFDQIAGDLEKGTARRLYEIVEKPDVTNTPRPRFDLLKLDSYVAMSVQFSRGCPFQCEFCDIITIYGRKPRTKSSGQLLAELEELYAQGWRQDVVVVDDNFIGNRKRALEFLNELIPWQRGHGYPFGFMTEASINLAQSQDLLDAMTAANFSQVFIGIESPSTESLTEIRKYQNLRQDLESSIRHIQASGLLVMGGFIIGFDSDGEDIFEQQRELIAGAAIPVAMIGFLQALHTTPLRQRLMEEGRLLEEDVAGDSFDLPNFRTKLPLEVLVPGYRDTLASLYDAGAYYDRALESSRRWRVRPGQKPPPFSRRVAATMLRSGWHQGIRSSYRQTYWRFLWRMVRSCGLNPTKVSHAMVVSILAHHLVSYAAEVTARLDRELCDLGVRPQDSAALAEEPAKAATSAAPA